MVQKWTPAQANAQRQLVRDNLSSVLSTCLAAAKKANPAFVATGTPIGVAKKIESALNNLYPVINRNGHYKNKFKSLKNNLKNPGNNQLSFAVLSGMTSAESLVRMTAQQMASDELKKLREKTVTEHLDEHVVIQEGALGVGVSIKSLHDYGDNKINTKSLESGNATFQAPKHLAESNAAKEAEADEVKSSRKRKNSKAISDSEANDDDDININGQRKAKKKRRSFLPELPKLQSFTSPAAAPVSSVGSAGTDITRGDELFSDDEEDDDDELAKTTSEDGMSCDLDRCHHYV